MSLDYETGSKQLTRYSFEMGAIRPPSEGQSRSLLIRATRNCPWNRCKFCGTYSSKFVYRSVKEVAEDINAARAISDQLKATSWRLGLAGEINNEVVRAVIQGNPEVYGKEIVEPEVLSARLNSLVNVANWINSAAKTVFLQDANTLIMRTPELVEVLTYLKETFPSVERITSYGRSKTAAKKSLDELKQLHQAGLSRLHIGLESGCNDVLRAMDKGVTAEGHISGGTKVVESGISLSEYVMPGLGGRKWSERHAIESAEVLNEINPDFIRLRTLTIGRNSALHDMVVAGDFQPLTEDEIVNEIGLFIENLDCDSYLASDQMSNLLIEIEGQLPQAKQEMLNIVAEYQAMPLTERLRFRLSRRLHSHMGLYGRAEGDVAEKLRDALEAIEAGSGDAEAKVDSAISALKGGFR